MKRREASTRGLQICPQTATTVKLCAPTHHLRKNPNSHKRTLMSHTKISVKILAAIYCAFSISGCATSSKDITEVYVSPLQYNSYDCDQLAAEEQRLRVRATQLGARLDTAAQNDKMLAGASVLLLYPIFFVGGNKAQEAEFARMKGEYSAVEQSAIAKKCSRAANNAAAQSASSPQ
jgi:hypothetical protein